MSYEIRRGAAELWYELELSKEETMLKFVPYEKLSKKERRKIDAARRTGWGELNPVTRKPENSRAYSRKKAQAWKKDPSLRFRLSKKAVGLF